MQFTQFLADFRLKTWTDEYSFPLENVITLTNGVLEEIHLLATNSEISEDHFWRVFTRDLAVWVRKYDLPHDLKSIKRVDLIIDGKLEYATEKDMSSINLTTLSSETDIQETMRGLKPIYEIFGRSIYFYTRGAIVTTTWGINIHGIQYPSMVETSDFDSSRDMSEPRDATAQGIPRTLHGIILFRSVIDYKESREKPIPLTQTEQNYVGRLKDVLKSHKVFNTDRKYKMSEPNDGYRNLNNRKYSPLN